jgi:NADH-quinone oxidoreductase subunit M
MIELLMFIIPVIGIAVMRFMPDVKSASRAALFISLLSVAETFWKTSSFIPDGGIQFLFDQYWMEDLGISFKTGMDGLSLLMVILTNVLVPLIIFSTFDREIPSYKNYFSLIFFMQFALLGVFSSFDGFLFYIFWELALLPIWFICLLWGGKDRARITLKFFIYTLSGSLLMLTGFIYLYLQTPGTHSFDYDSLTNLSLTDKQQSFLFWTFFAAFAVKIPIFPLHTWQPDTYTNAPVQGTMLLAGIMLKMGLYGVLRWMLPVIPSGINEWAWLAILLSAIGILYASAMAIAQKDFKRLIAYSSIAHVGLISAGLFTVNAMAMQGAVYQMLSHGINVVGLFFISEILIRRFKGAPINSLGGIANSSTVFAVFFMIIMLGSIALPLTNGFIGEFMLLSGIYHYSGYVAAFCGLTIILGAVYMLRSYQRIMLGNESETTSHFSPLTINEKILLGIISILVVAMGIYPQPLLNIAAPALQDILAKASIG